MALINSKLTMLLKTVVLNTLFVCVYTFAQPTVPHSIDAVAALQTTVDSKVQEDAVKELITRLIGDRSNDFVILIDPEFNNNQESFQIIASDGVVSLSGSNGVSVASGFHHYLKYYCNCHVSWEANQLQLPEQWPEVDVTIAIQQKARYYQNTCTSSYSFVWWNWQDWEKNIDWMALNGINLPLAFTAQEAIWQRVYENLGLTQDEIDAYFTGPAFFAWNRMGNVHGWGGPLPSEWHTQRLVLQHQILDRMRSFGMTPVLPAFAGFVPNGMTRIFPSSNIKGMVNWMGFEASYCCTMFVDPLDPLFKQIGNLFLEELISEFGTNHIYNCDNFNEMRPQSNEPAYIASVATAVYESMAGVDPDAIWMMQGWLFRNDPGTWQPPQAEALLTSVPIGRMIILDLEAELNPVYSRMNNFYGQPFIWCMLHNFGGTLGLFGVLDNVNQGVYAASSYPNSTMMGVGLTMEGINQNYVMYDFMMETKWRTEPVDLDQWIRTYAKRRYGVENEDIFKAWKLLQDSAYSSNLQAVKDLPPENGSSTYQRMHSSEVQVDQDMLSTFGYYGQHILVKRPSLTLQPYILYNPDLVDEAYELMLKVKDEMQSCPTYTHDLADIARETFQNSFAKTYQQLVQAFNQKNDSLTSQYGNSMLSILDEMDRILSTEKPFMLGSWTSAARSWGATTEEKQLLEQNARNQITLWGPKGEILDYAAKQWSGVISGYYKPRWELFIQHLLTALQNGEEFSQWKFNQEVFDKAEKPFTLVTSD